MGSGPGARAGNQAGARAALVTAPAGTGKSRIRHDFVNGIKRREKPVVIWLGRGDSISAGSPFGMIAPAIRRAAGILDGEPLALRQAKLRARLARHLAGPELQRVTEFLGELIGVPFPDGTSIELRSARQDSRLMGDQMMRAWQDWLAAEAAAQPVVIVLEDLHWGDPPTVSFTDAALRHLKDRPLMVLALARPEVHEVFPKLWTERGAQEIRLGELTRQASERLVREVLRASVPDQTVERIAKLAAGNAFYLEELIRAVSEGREEALPETVLAMIEARLASLEPEARRILRAASVFGASFRRGGVAALLGSSEGASGLDDWLKELVERELVTSRPQSKFAGEREYQFRHDLVREAAYAMLTEGDRVLGHRLAAAWLERAGEVEPMVLAEHFERGGEPARALGWFHKAAQQSLEGNDLPAAVERAERAVACGAVVETLGTLRLLQAEAECWRGHFAEAERYGTKAMERLPHGGPQWASAGNYLQWAAGVQGHEEVYRRIVGAFLDLPPDHPPHGEAIITMAWLAATCIVRGERDLSVTLFAKAEALALALVSAHPSAEANLLETKAWAISFAGDAAAAINLTEALIQAYLRIGDLRRAATSRGNVAFLLVLLGEYGRGIEILRENVTMAERLGLAVLAAHSRQNLALALYALGELPEARALAEASLREFQTFGDLRGEGTTLKYLAMILLALGDLAAAEVSSRRSVEILTPMPVIRAHALAILARVLLARGESAAGLATTEEGMALFASGSTMDEGEAYLRLAHAEALATNGRRDEAHQAIRAARDRLRERAAKISRAEWRESFLTNVPENARTLALAREWLGEA